MSATYLAIDLGASNGRVIVGHLENNSSGKTLRMEVVHRFGNRPVKIGEFLYWDFPALFAEIKRGLSLAASKYNDVVSLGVDTWGVDFGLIDRMGNLVGNPVCYRDQHTVGQVEDFIKHHDVSAHYAEAGIQMLPINTLFRLRWMSQNQDPKLEIANHLLFMPDLFSYYLSGKLGNEYTIASTSELLLAKTGEWNFPLIKSLGLSTDLFGEILKPGTLRGTLLKEIAMETGLNENVRVVSVGSHDTASAVYAMADSYNESQAAFLSSGTWSLLGVLSDTPVLSEDARVSDYTNEGGIGGKIRLLTNITGLWILQQLVYQWEKEGQKLSWDELIDEAEKASDTILIDVDDPMFQEPEGMEQTIREYCHLNNLQAPATRGEFVRAVCRSLAERYKKAIDNLNGLLPLPIKKLIVFGGGSRNRLLTRFTAEATGLELEVKEAEATAVGNLLLQAVSHGEIKDKNEITKTVFL